MAEGPPSRVVKSYEPAVQLSDMTNRSQGCVTVCLSASPCRWRLADLPIRKRLYPEVSRIGFSHSTAPGQPDLRFLKQSSAFAWTELHSFLVRSVHWCWVRYF